MPIYEYRCDRCGVFEEVQRITDASLTHCPTCRGKVRRLISSTSFQLKGSGWYVTDYARKNGSKGETTSSEKPASTSDGKSEAATGSSETKSEPEKKPAAKASSSSSTSKPAS